MSDDTIGPAVQRLLDRLDAIALSLGQRSGSLALMGLGSVGLEVGRADRFSDLDFFVIAEPQAAPVLRADLGWLRDVHPLSFTHRNTTDGWKVLFEDRIFAEFAVFSPDQLPDIPFQAGRLVWARPDFDVSCLAPRRGAEPVDATWAVSEALTCLYVGLGRFHRGERLAAHRLIQGCAFDLVLSVMQCTDGKGEGADPFNPSRRIEQMRPDRVAWLKQTCRGYGHTLDAAQVLLTELARFGRLPEALVAEIEILLALPALKEDDAAL